MEELRERLKAADRLAQLEQQIAELYARDVGFPTLEDMGPMVEAAHRFARAAMELVRAQFGDQARATAAIEGHWAEPRMGSDD